MGSLELKNTTLEIDGRSLVGDVSFSLSPGRLTVLVGPNGSGKTTVLRLAAGLVLPTRGEVLLDDHPIGKFSRREVAKRLALVPQNTGCPFAFSVREMVAMGRNPHLGRFARETSKDRRLVSDAMRQADVEPLADRLVTELSGGELQRTAIARCLATEAEILLLDEPTANLDIAHALDVLELCRTLAGQGKSVCMALHDLNAAVRIADHVVLLYKGEIFAQGEPCSTLSPDTIREVFGVRAELASEIPGGAPYVFERI